MAQRPPDRLLVTGTIGLQRTVAAAAGEGENTQVRSLLDNVDITWAIVTADALDWEKA